MNEWKLPSKNNSQDYWERNSESRKESKINKKRGDKNPWTPVRSW